MLSSLSPFALLKSSNSAVVFTLLLLLLLLLQGNNVTAQQSNFLKEIILGRCYDKSPVNGSPDAVAGCPTIIGSIMGILESHKDSDIQASHFDGYVQTADFTSPPDGALFWLKAATASAATKTKADVTEAKEAQLGMIKPVGFVMPEDTPGGSLLKDLVFCGVDRRQTCALQESHAYVSFWEAAYVEFASCITGTTVHVIVEPNANVSSFLDTVLPQISQNEHVSNIVLVSRDCNNSESSENTALLNEDASSRTIAMLISEFKRSMPQASTKCTPPSALYSSFCTEGKADKKRSYFDEYPFDDDDEDEPSPSDNFQNFVLITSILVALVLSYWYYNNERKNKILEHDDAAARKTAESSALESSDNVPFVYGAVGEEAPMGIPSNEKVVPYQ